MDDVVVIVDSPLTVCSSVEASKTAADADGAAAVIFRGVFGDLGLVGGTGDLTGAIGGFVMAPDDDSTPGAKKGFSVAVGVAKDASGVWNTLSETETPTA